MDYETIGHFKFIADASQMSVSIYFMQSAMPGKHRNDRVSRTWFYFPGALTISPMHRGRRNKSVSINKYPPATVTDASQAPSDYLETCIQSYGNQPLDQDGRAKMLRSLASFSS